MRSEDESVSEVLCVSGPAPRKGWVVRCWGAGCYKWYQSRPSRLRVRVSVRAYGAWRVCARVGTHGMAYGAGTGRAGVRQGGTFLDICPVWVSWTDEDVGFFEGGV